TWLAANPRAVSRPVRGHGTSLRPVLHVGRRTRPPRALCDVLTRAVVYPGCPAAACTAAVERDHANSVPVHAADRVRRDGPIGLPHHVRRRGVEAQRGPVAIFGWLMDGPASDAQSRNWLWMGAPLVTALAEAAIVIVGCGGNGALVAIGVAHL